MNFPRRLLFRTTVTCPKVDDIEIGTEPSEFDGIEPLPPLGTLEGQEPFADVKIAYNESGLYVALFVEREDAISVSRQRPHSADSLQVWLDTRGGVAGHRATRFCHQFVCLGKGGGPQREEPVAWEEQIRRGARQSSLAQPGDIPLISRDTDTDYSLQVHFPADILRGFEPEPGENMRFNVLVTDYVHGRQNYCCAGEFPYTYDPSTWAGLVLGD
ncbi:MAG: hypothetical protein ACLFWB_10435 [Armatimonadota bacterium]